MHVIMSKGLDTRIMLIKQSGYGTFELKPH